MIRFHPAVLLATILLVGVTIFLASQKPAKMAADISPIESLGYRPTHKTVKERKAGKGKVIARLSMEQFTKDKKRTAVVLLSLAASLSADGNTIAVDGTTLNLPAWGAAVLLPAA